MSRRQAFAAEQRIRGGADVQNASLQLREDAAGAGPEMAKIPAGGTEDAAVLAPQEQSRPMEQQRVRERANGARVSAERAANQADGQGLIIQVGGLFP